MKRILLISLLGVVSVAAVASIFKLHNSAPASACYVNKEIPTTTSGFSGLNPKVFQLALTAYNCALKSGYKDPKHLLTVIDYTLPSTAKRLWVIDLTHKQVLFNTLVAQGKYTGGLMARYFSDKPESKESSLGLFLTESPYVGHDGYSLRINGLEPGFNDKALDREIVIHGAWYVSNAFAKREGRIGLSWGCPAVPKELVTPIINTIKDGTFLFSYFPDPNWLARSKFLHCGG